MNDKDSDGLQALQRFYRELEQVPVPVLARRSGLSGFRSFSLVLAPVLASACAYFFFICVLSCLEYSIVVLLPN